MDTRLPHLLHGCDYNPDQWLDQPDILAEDLRLMERAGINAVTIGTFSWTALEPEEGRYEFGWLDRLFAGLAERGIAVILATPTGARPAWMSQKYPEVLRVGADRRRNLHGGRHNHCYTSPVYREKARAVNRELARRYGGHPALLLWHLSNEYGGECHCGLCQAAFRAWLRERYEDDLEKLNRAWWASFWSHTFTGWGEIESPAPHGELYLPALALDWKRFVTDQTVDFLKAEAAPLRELSPRVPTTTNLMGTYPGLNYRRLAEAIDLVSWDSYPCWHGSGPPLDAQHAWDPLGRDWKVAADTAFAHNLMRGLKGGRPFLLMESSPTFSNWHPVPKLKRPGMHRLSSLLAVAHGSDSVQYFQWRKGRGGFEKLHGAVVDHDGSAETRVFREVVEVGQALGRLDGVRGAAVPAEAAVLFDWETRWALEEALGRHPDGKRIYEAACKAHHEPFWAMGVPVDIAGPQSDLAGYRLLAAPMLYLVAPRTAVALDRFVREGGTLVLTCWSGMVGESDLCFLGGFPGPLRAMAGVWSEELDGLYPSERNRVVMREGNGLGLAGEYEAGDFCDLIHAETAEVLAEYGSDFYRGRPALTANRFGRGTVYYIASCNEERFLSDFYRALAGRLGLKRALPVELPEGVTAQVRAGREGRYVFLLNFNPGERAVDLGPAPWRDLLSGARLSGTVALEGYGVRVLQAEAAG
jgi:beta-galactosidase